MATQVKNDTPAQKTVHYISSYPIVGNLPEYSRDRLNLLKRIADAGDVYGMHFGPFPAVMFNKPEHIHSILVEHAYDFDKGDAIHNVFRPIAGDGIFTSEGDLHRRQRKLMAPSFQPRHIASYASIMGQYGEQIQQTWQDGAIIDIDQQMTNLTMSIIGKALFDADVFTETDELGDAVKPPYPVVEHKAPLRRRTRPFWDLGLASLESSNGLVEGRPLRLGMSKAGGATL
jgi:cytochrome P450